MENRPVVYEDLHSYVPKMGTLEYWKGLGNGQIEFRFKIVTSDRAHYAEFACAVSASPTGDDYQKMLKCVQQAHDWLVAHEAPVSNLPMA